MLKSARINWPWFKLASPIIWFTIKIISKTFIDASWLTSPSRLQSLSTSKAPDEQSSQLSKSWSPHKNWLLGAISWLSIIRSPSESGHANNVASEESK